MRANNEARVPRNANKANVCCFHGWLRIWDFFSSSLFIHISFCALQLPAREKYFYCFNESLMSNWYSTWQSSILFLPLCFWHFNWRFLEFSLRIAIDWALGEGWRWKENCWCCEGFCVWAFYSEKRIFFAITTWLWK